MLCVEWRLLKASALQRMEMDTTSIKDKAERKKLKREARSKRSPKAKRTDPRGSHKPKVKKKGAASKR